MLIIKLTINITINVTINVTIILSIIIIILFYKAVRNAGVRAVKQKLCKSSDDVSTFCKELIGDNKNNKSGKKEKEEEQGEEEFKCVVKPNESAGTDSVFLCKTPADVEKAFQKIHNHSNGLGHTNNGALCQEFLSGTEYVIDGVSRDGVYKVRTYIHTYISSF